LQGDHTRLVRAVHDAQEMAYTIDRKADVTRINLGIIRRVDQCYLD
jgi:hypothetical protein